MKIGVDASVISQSKAGIGYYAYELLNAIINLDKSNEYILYTNDKSNISDLRLGPNFSITEIKSQIPNLSWMWKVYNQFKKDNIDIFLSTSNLFFGTIFPNTITFLYDLSKIKFPQFFSKKSIILYRLEFEILIRREKIITTISDTVKSEIIQINKITKDKVYNIGAGLHRWAYQDFNTEKNKVIKEKYDLPNKYLLSVSTLEPRKNYINSIKAFAKFLKTNSDWYYLIAGKKGWFYEEIFKTVKDLNLENRVIFLGYIPEEDLAPLYDQSSGFLYLSFYEGFGLPLLEAYSRKIPIIASDIPVLKEFMIGKAIFANPNNIEAIAKAMSQLKNIEINKIDKTFINSYSWENSASKLLSLYKLLNLY